MDANTLGGIVVKIFGRRAQLYAWPMVSIGQSVALNVASGTLADGNTIQILPAAQYQYIRLTAPRTNAASIWFNLGAAANKDIPSIEITPGSSEVWVAVVPNLSLNIIGTAGDKYVIHYV